VVYVEIKGERAKLLARQGRFPLRGGRAPFFDNGLLRLFLPSVVLRHLFLYLYDGRR